MNDPDTNEILRHGGDGRCTYEAGDIEIIRLKKKGGKNGERTKPN